MKKENLTMEQRRANRIVVNANENNEGWTAEFYKTHFLIGTINSIDSKWQPDNSLTMTGNRESFRQWAIENSSTAGAIWIPDDLREDWNIRVEQYSNDELVTYDISKMIAQLVLPNLENEMKKLEITYLRADFEEIVPTTTTSKGNPIQYVSDGKYDKNGNWAWCTIDTTLVFDYKGSECYITRQFSIVSGCLKKMKITKPEFEMELRAQIAQAQMA